MNETRTPDAFTIALRKQLAHTDLSRDIESIASGTYQWLVNSESFMEPHPVFATRTIPRQMSDMHAEWIFNALKTERNASLVIFINELWHMSEPSRNVFPIGYVGTHAMDLKSYSKQILHAAAQDWVAWRTARLSQPPEDITPLDVAFVRYRGMINLAAHHRLTNNRTPEDFIIGGINTASNVIWGVVSLAQRMSRVAGLPTGRDYILPIVERSYGPVIRTLASIHKDVAVPIFHAIFDISMSELDPEYFHLRETPGGPVLAFNHAAMMGIRTDGGLPILHKTTETPNTMCPAGHRVPSEPSDVIREYFRWSLSIASACLSDE